MPTVSLWSWMQSHPFMVTSWSPGKQGILELFVETRHGFTQALQRATALTGSATFRAFGSGHHGTSKSVDQYETVLAVASGFCVAGIIPHIQQLLHGYNTSTSRVRRVHLVWQFQTLDLAIAVQPLMNSLLTDDVLDNGYVGVCPRVSWSATSSEIQNAPNGTKKGDGDSIYRVASLSKLFTVFAALRELNSEQWERPLTEIMPSFAEYVKSRSDKDSVYSTPWDQITPSALAAQISGVARDVLPWDGGDLLLQYAIAILAGLDPVPAAVDPATYGLPPVDLNDALSLSPCLANVSLPCTGSLYAAGAANDPPVYLPWTSPAYSNNGFILLGLALTNLTGKSLDEIYKQSIFDPLAMHSSSSTVPGTSELSRSVIAGDFASGFGYEGGISKSSGGIYSTTNDLAKFGTAILNSTLLPPVATRRWMKPVSHTADLQYSVGRPWEIYRYKHAKSGVVTDLYTKLGDSGNYGSFLVLIPDFNAGFSIIGASALATRSNATSLLADLVTEAILPALMEQAASEARKNFAGKYTSHRLNSSLALTVSSPGNLGLSITWSVSNGTDLMPLLAILLGNENSRLVPTITTGGAGQVAFRPYTATQEKSGGLFQRNFDVNDWLVAGSGGYATKSLGEFVFSVDAQGNATKVELPAWNVTLHR